MSRILRESAESIAAQVLGLALGLGAGVLVARTLGPTAKGTIALYTMMAAVLATVGNLGLGAANVHLVGSGRATAERAWANSWWLSWTSGTGLAVAAFFLSPLLALALAKPIDMSLLAIALAGVPLAILLDCQLNLLRGLQRMRLVNLAAAARQALRLLLLMLFILFLKQGTSGALWALNIGLALASLLAFLLLRRQTAVSLRPSFHLLRESLGYGIKVQPGQVLQFFNYRLDIFLLALFWNSREVGLYTTATFAAELLWYIPNGINLVLFPTVSGTKDSREAGRLSAPIIRHTLLWTAILALGLGIAAEVLVTALYGENFRTAAHALRVLLLGVVAMAPGKLALNHLAGIGKPQYLTYAALAGLAATVALDLALIPRFGMMGAAWASAAAYTLTGAAGIWWLKRQAGVGLRESLVIRSQDLDLYQRTLGL